MSLYLVNIHDIRKGIVVFIKDNFNVNRNFYVNRRTTNDVQCKNHEVLYVNLLNQTQKSEYINENINVFCLFGKRYGTNTYQVMVSAHQNSKT